MFRSRTTKSSKGDYDQGGGSRVVCWHGAGLPIWDLQSVDQSGMEFIGIIKSLLLISSHTMTTAFLGIFAAN